MISPALGRALLSPSCISSSPSVCAIGRLGITAAQQPLSLTHRPKHQRRLSSSKASIPPDGPDGLNGSGSPQQTSGTRTAKAGASKKATGRSTKKRGAAAPLNVPHVPPTDYLQKTEVKLSSFFSLHRPMSVVQALPPVSSSATFNSIFDKKPSKQRMIDNIQTLSGGIESLEATLRSYDEKHPTETIVEEAESVDGPPAMTIDQIMAKYVPFSPPPAPVPLDQMASFETTQSQPEAQPTVQSKQRAWSTAVVVTESTDAAGKRTYSASTAPMVEIQYPESGNNAEIDEVEIRQPFLERMHRKQNTPGMMAISVKRQRKLKMKKHKYKKLMKRTRLLRRKLDRN